ncbi:hypothetical protein ACHAXR_004199, partial [Thalassiosira sp. AJA248-18]
MAENTCSWICVFCTFKNENPMHLVCGICDKERPSLELAEQPNAAQLWATLSTKPSPTLNSWVKKQPPSSPSPKKPQAKQPSSSPSPKKPSAKQSPNRPKRGLSLRSLNTPEKKKRSPNTPKKKPQYLFSRYNSRKDSYGTYDNLFSEHVPITITQPTDRLLNSAYLEFKRSMPALKGNPIDTPKNRIAYKDAISSALAEFCPKQKKCECSGCENLAETRPVRQDNSKVPCPGKYPPTVCFECAKKTGTDHLSRRAECDCGWERYANSAICKWCLLAFPCENHTICGNNRTKPTNALCNTCLLLKPCGNHTICGNNRSSSNPTSVLCNTCLLELHCKNYATCGNTRSSPNEQFCNKCTSKPCKRCITVVQAHRSPYCEGCKPLCKAKLSNGTFCPNQKSGERSKCMRCEVKPDNTCKRCRSGTRNGTGLYCEGCKPLCKEKMSNGTYCPNRAGTNGKGRWATKCGSSNFAPTVFKRNSDIYKHVVYNQPTTNQREELDSARAALAACPVAAIRVENNVQDEVDGPELKDSLSIQHDQPFPQSIYPFKSAEGEPVDIGAYYLGHHNDATFGATPYLILGKSPAGRDISVMVDVPRFSPSSVRAVKSLTAAGPDYMFLTHVDDTADHNKWKNEFPTLKRIFHSGDLGRHNWVGDLTLEDVEILLQEGKEITSDDGLNVWDIDGNQRSSSGFDQEQQFLIVHTPGHSPGSISLLFRPKSHPPNLTGTEFISSDGDKVKYPCGVLFTGD